MGAACGHLACLAASPGDLARRLRRDPAGVREDRAAARRLRTGEGGGLRRGARPGPRAARRRRQCGTRRPPHQRRLAARHGAGVSRAEIRRAGRPVSRAGRRRLGVERLGRQVSAVGRRRAAGTIDLPAAGPAGLRGRARARRGRDRDRRRRHAAGQPSLRRGSRPQPGRDTGAARAGALRTPGRRPRALGRRRTRRRRHRRPHRPARAIRRARPRGGRAAARPERSQSRIARGQSATPAITRRRAGPPARGHPDRHPAAVHIHGHATAGEPSEFLRGQRRGRGAGVSRPHRRGRAADARRVFSGPHDRARCLQ